MIFLLKFFNQMKAIKIFNRFPCVFTICKTFPLNQIMNFAINRTFFVNNAVISSCGQIMLPRKATGKDSVIAFKRVQKLSYHQSQTHSPFCCDACLWLWSNKRLLWHNQFVYFEFIYIRHAYKDHPNIHLYGIGLNVCIYLLVKRHYSTRALHELPESIKSTM